MNYCAVQKRKLMLEAAEMSTLLALRPVEAKKVRLARRLRRRLAQPVTSLLACLPRNADCCQS